MYRKDKHRVITLRLSTDQYNDIKRYADMWQVSQSAFIRSLIDSYRYSHSDSTQNIHTQHFKDI